MSDGGRYFDERKARRDTAEGAAAGLLEKLDTTVFNQSTSGGTNLVISPDFSDSTIQRCFSGGPGSGYSSTRAHSGTQSWKVVAIGGTYCDTFLFGMSTTSNSRDNFLKVRAGEKYSAEAWAYAETANVNSWCMVWCLFVDSTGVNTDLFADLSDVNIPEGVWNKLTAEVAVPDGYDRMVFAVSNRAANTTGDTIHFDDVLVRETTTLGLLNSSVTAGSNMVIDPSFEDTSIVRPVFDDPAVMAYSTEQAHSKTHCLKATHFSGLSAGFLMMPAPAPSGGFWNNFGAKFIRVSWLQKYRVKVWVFPKATNGPVNGQAILGAYVRNSITGAETWLELGHTVTLGSWQEISDIFTIPFGYDQMQPYAYTHGSFNSNGNIFYWDDPSVTDETWTQNIIQQLFGGPAIGSEILPAAVPSLDWSKITNLIDMWLGKGSIGTNLVADPGFEDSTFLRNSTGAKSTDQAHSGTKSWKFPSHVNGVNQDLNIVHTSQPTGTDAYTDNRQWYKVTPGQKYYYEYWVFPKATNTLSGSKVRFQVGFRNNAGGGEFFTTFALTSNGEAPLGVWTKVSGYFTIDSGVGLMLPDVHIDDSNPSGNIFYIDDLVLQEESSSQDIISKIISAWTGTTAALVNPVSTAQTVMAGAKNSISSLAATVAQMQALQGGNTNSGKSYAVSFASYPNGALPAIFTTTLSGTGDSVLQVASGYVWFDYGTNNIARQHNSVYNAGVTDTDYQIGCCSVTNYPDALAFTTVSGANYIRLRSNTAGTSYVYIKTDTDGFGNLFYELGCVVSGTPTVWVSRTQITFVENVWLACGTAGGLRIYRVYAGSQLINTYTEVGTTSQVGASYRSASFGGDVAANSGRTFTPGLVSSFQFADNVPPTTVGSGYFVTRTNTSTVTFNSGNNLLPNSFFDTTERSTTDIAYNPTTNAYTVINAGWYVISLGIKINTLNNTQMTPLIYNNTTLLRGGTPSVNVGTLASTWEEYLPAGTVLRPGVHQQAALGAAMQGDTSGVYSYWGIALSNRSLT